MANAAVLVISGVVACMLVNRRMYDEADALKRGHYERLAAISSAASQCKQREAKLFPPVAGDGGIVPVGPALTICPFQTMVPVRESSSLAQPLPIDAGSIDAASSSAMVPKNFPIHPDMYALARSKYDSIAKIVRKFEVQSAQIGTDRGRTRGSPIFQTLRRNVQPFGGRRPTKVGAFDNNCCGGFADQVCLQHTQAFTTGVGRCFGIGISDGRYDGVNDVDCAGSACRRKLLKWSVAANIFFECTRWDRTGTAYFQHRLRWVIV